MVCQSCLTDPSVQIVVDTSVTINLVATRVPEAILDALPNRLFVTEEVYFEFRNGGQAGGRSADAMSNLVAASQVEIVRLESVGSQIFESLIIGPGSETLDDGEAATIACALERNASVLIDERKANRICAERFPQLRIGCTVDLLSYPQVQLDLGVEQLSEAVFNALYYGRMRVLPRHVKWVINLIGPERATLCRSLSRSIRNV